jgi:hypothetical protein
VKVTKWMGLKDLGFDFSPIERADLKKSIQDHWCGRSSSNIGIARVSLTGGLVSKSVYAFERRDIGMLQFYERARPGHVQSFLFNVFVEPDGSHGGPDSSDVKITDAERAYLDDLVSACVRDNADFIARQRRFFVERPWESILGMTPDEAVRALEAAGW